MSRHRVQIEVDSLGHGTVKIDDMDVSDLTIGFRLSAAVGDRTTVELDLSPHSLDFVADADLIVDFYGPKMDVTQQGDERRRLVCPLCDTVHLGEPIE